jgi:hypothetical protein
MNTRILRSYRGALLTLSLLCLAADARADQELLASAKTLYESASYEAALSELSAISNTELADTVDTYRALCLLGLGRSRDAEQVLEDVVTRKPLLVLSDAEFSPRLVSLFQEVRRKALPAAARRLYTSAKTDYENKKYDAAALGFKQTLQVIADLGPDSQTATLADLKELASGFLTLAESKRVAPERAAATPDRADPAPQRAAAAAPRAAVPAAAVPGAAVPAAAVAPGVAPGPSAPKAAQTFYTVVDPGVTPPVALNQQLPPWNATPQIKTGVFTGTLEVMVNEKGAVENVTLLDPVWPTYDSVLLLAAKAWRYEPAVKDGKPVKFKKVLAISVNPQTQGQKPR